MEAIIVIIVIIVGILFLRRLFRSEPVTDMNGEPIEVGALYCTLSGTVVEVKSIHLDKVFCLDFEKRNRFGSTKVFLQDPNYLQKYGFGETD